MLKQRLQQKLQQKLSPLQIQTIKLLEVPVMQLEQRIKEELENNPVLEQVDSDEEESTTIEANFEEPANSDVSENDDEFSLEDYFDEDEYIPSYRLNAQNYSPDDKHPTIPLSSSMSFHEYLESQLGELSLDDRQLMIASFIIGNIDDDGYLRRNLDAIVDDLAFLQNINTDEKEVLQILRMIQEFDPPGVGARNLQECLLLQIEQKDLSNPTIQLAKKILSNCFEEFTKKHYEKIASRLNISQEDLKAALDEILRLNPKPGSAFASSASTASEQIIPDFILDYKDGEFILSLNSKNIPELRISRAYTEMIEDLASGKGDQKSKRELMTFVRQKIESARWFIEAIKQRQNTLLSTMQAILNYQAEYFKEGDEKKLKPMILKDIADITGYDVSTISRVANSKYIQTHFGIIPLKYLFSEPMQNESGAEVSTREIKKILEECVASEDKRNPLTDDELAEILKQKGYPIARRTVAKYREQLGIPVARLRKELS
ncbi:MAG TPA: RNA polymerase factor sigma-54 [Bacteroidales bacterium]|nr:RNA polymerase factor sigma-54 [Bacteroidales bacterium]HPO65709.1 RNA polymerase factor sigma-54 [Bacteroidales bacterium]